MIYIGIDISKKHFDADLGGKVRRFANDAQGIEAFRQLLPENSHAVLEATGAYSLRVTVGLQQAGVPVSVVNPLAVKRFGESRLRRAKTDRADAKLLSDFGRTMQPAATTPADEASEQLRQREKTIELLKQQRTALKNQLEALEYSPWPAPDVVRVLKQNDELLKKQIAELEKQQQQLIDTQWPGLSARLRSIPGIGVTTARALVIATRGFTRLQQSPKLLAYIGLCPRIAQSGQGRGRAWLSKQGQAELRRLLYMCSWQARKVNPACRALYERLLARGKAGKVALCAVAAKLVRQACGLARNQQPYDPHFSLLAR